MSIETPFPYSYVAKGLLAELGIDPTQQASYDRSATVFAGMGSGVFFDSAHFGTDKLVTGYRKKPWDVFFAETPMSPAARADLVRLFTERRDWLPGLTPQARAEALKRMSYQDFLTKHVGLRDEAVQFFAGQGYRNNMRIDMCPAWSAMRYHAPGFAGMEVAEAIEAESPNFHFPDGNASVARLLVNRLVPDAIPEARDMDSVVAARADYAKLDLPTNPTRIRLSSMVVRVEHLVGAPQGTVPTTVEKAVRVVYVRADGSRASVTAAGVVLACFNTIIPFIAPELPEHQRQALRYASKVPMQYTSVLLRNAQAMHAAGVRQIQAPFGYHSNAFLDAAISIGGYAGTASIEDPVVLKMIRNPNAPGGGSRREQNRAGRADMLNTPYEVSERAVRDQLQAMLGPFGFDHRRDILAITINRWPHGYAYSYDTLGDPDLPERERPHVIGRQPWGRITIANSDSAAQAFTNAAIDMAHRAVGELLVARGLT